MRYGLSDDCTALPHLATPGVCNRCGKTLTGRQTQWCSMACSNELTREHDWNWARKAARQRDGERCVRCGGDGAADRPIRWLPVETINQARRIGLDWSQDARPHGLFVAQRRLHLPWIEVNHIDPRQGRGYGWGCHNHLANLETLCHRCHVDETNRQAADRRATARLDTVDTDLGLFSVGGLT